MKVRIRDLPALRAIRPLDVTGYLRQQGWEKIEQKVNCTTWGQGEFEVLVPLDTAFHDYGRRMAELLQTLAASEQRSEAELFGDLTTSGADVVRLRLIDPNAETGSIPLERAAVMGAKARDLLFAAACAAKSAKAVYGPRRSQETLDYMRSVRMGQTEHGSFVLKLLSPVPPRLGQMSLSGMPSDEQEEPFARRVVLRLAQGVQAMRDAALTAVGNGSMDPFQEAVPRGVSANLCDAMAGLKAPQEDDQGLEFSVSWAVNRPLHGTAPKSVMFTPDVFPVIEEAAREFRETQPREDFEVYGPVIKLERESAEQAGKVTLSALVEEQPRKVVLELDGEEYHKALDAHDKGDFVRCTGTLLKVGKTYRSRHPSGLEVEPSE